MSARAGGESATVDAVADRIANARIAKALALAKKIREGMVAAVKDFSPEEWVDLAKRAGQNAPSEKTQKIVIGILGEL